MDYNSEMTFLEWLDLFVKDLEISESHNLSDMSDFYRGWILGSDETRVEIGKKLRLFLDVELEYSREMRLENAVIEIMEILGDVAQELDDENFNILVDRVMDISVEALHEGFQY